MRIDLTTTFSFSPMHRLQWEEVQQKNVILYPEGMVELNQSSAEILKLCDGVRQVNQIIRALELKFETTGLEKDVINFLEDALKNGWIHTR